VGQYGYMHETMIATPDVLARKAHIESIPGAVKPNEAFYMRHRTLIDNMGSFSGFGRDPNSIVWFRKGLNHTGRPRNLIDALSTRHMFSLKALRTLLADMGTTEVSTLPDWVAKQLFGYKCDDERCQCASFEALNEQGAQSGDGRIEDVPIDIA
jgi:hypothetical protein